MENHPETHTYAAEKGSPALNVQQPAPQDRHGPSGDELEPTVDHASGTKKERKPVSTVAYEGRPVIGQRYRILRAHAKGGLGQVLARTVRQRPHY
jgi:hypothetical protein